MLKIDEIEMWTDKSKKKPKQFLPIAPLWALPISPGLALLWTRCFVWWKHLRHISKEWEPRHPRRAWLQRAISAHLSWSATVLRIHQADKCFLTNGPIRSHMGPYECGPGPQSIRNHFQNSHVKQIISYPLVARSESKIHTNPRETIPHPFPHVLGGGARGGVGMAHVERDGTWFYVDL